jgi:hypothetical protein
MAIDDYLPASIRTNNPGAQWFGPIARQFGATGAQSLPGGNNAAVFDDPVNGAAAQFALWAKNYSGMPLSAAISKWSGGNSSPSYTAFLTKQTGLSPDTVLTPQLLASPQGLALAKAQAHWEVGKPYPLSDEQWAQAQAKGLGGATAPAQASSGGAVPMAPAATGQPALASAAAPGGQAPGGTPSAGMGMLSGADLSGAANQGGSDIGMLAQKAMAMLKPQQQMPPPPPINYPIPAALRARMQQAALGQG